VSLQLAPGQGKDPDSLAFAVPPDITTSDIERRVDELRSAPMEALKPVPPPAPVVPPAPAAPPAPAGPETPGSPAAYGRRRRAWPTAARGPQASRYRVAFEKIGIARFTSHLDLVRIFDRAIRVAKIPIAYSQGFNRHAKIAYGPPLSLGATSRAEYFDLELAQACPWSTIAAMNDILPEGITILEGRPFTKSLESLMASIARADYRVTLTGYLMDRLSRGEDVHRVRHELERSVAAFGDAADWPITKPSHGQKGRTVNARPAVSDLSLLEDGEALGVRLSSRLQAPGYLRPDLLFKSLLPSFEFDPRLLLVSRESMWVERGTTLLTPLEALEESAFWRPVPAGEAPAAAPDPLLEPNASRDHH
jgi:radical SAM-linked protein